MMKKWGLGNVWVAPHDVREGYIALCYILKYLTKENTMNDRVMMPRGMLRPIVSYNEPKPNLIPLYEHAIYVMEADVTITSSLYKKH